MISRNLQLQYTDGKYFVQLPRSDNMELASLARKYKDTIHVKITKPRSPKTESQNATIHALLDTWYYSDCHSAPEWVTSILLFKQWAKKTYGKAIYEQAGNETLVFLPSVADYSKDELREFISKVKHDIETSGALAESYKLQEIFAGIEMYK